MAAAFKPHDRSGGHHFIEQRHRDLARDRIRVEFGAFGILDEQRGVDAVQRNLSHRPVREAALVDFLVAQQHDVLMPRVVGNLVVQLVDFQAPAFEDLQKNPAAAAQYAGDAVLWIAGARFDHDGGEVVLRNGFLGAAAVHQAD